MVLRHSPAFDTTVNQTTPDASLQSSDPSRISLKQIQQQIELAQTMLHRYAFAPALLAKLTHQLQTIQQQLADRDSPFALISESSSDKNTFINALLEDNLLPTTGLCPTTAITKIHHHPTLKVNVNLHGGSLVVWQHGNQALAQALGMLNPAPDTVAAETTEQRRLAQCLKTNERVAAQLQSIEIQHPANFLKNHVTIVDVPGTLMNQVEQEEAMYDVLEANAGIVVVLIPATQPLSQKLIVHLNQSFWAYRQRCVFVLTQMSQISSDQPAHVLATIRSQLAMLLELESPIVYPCAPEVVLNQLDGVPTDIVTQPWLATFQQFKHQLLDRLEQSRLLHVEQDLSELLNRILTILIISLRCQQTNHTQRQQALTKSLTRDLPQFIKQQTRICHEHLDDAHAIAQQALFETIEQYQQQVLDQAHSHIYAATNCQQLLTIKSSTLSLLPQYGRRLQKVLLKASNHIARAGSIAETQMQQGFTKNHHYLQTIDPMIAIPNITLDDSLSLDHRTLNNLIQITDAEASQKQLPIKPKERSLRKTQDHCWQEIQTVTQAFFDRYEQAASPLLRNYQQQLMLQLSKILETYHITYQQTSNQLSDRQAAKQKKLQTFAQQLYTDMLRIRV